MICQRYQQFGQFLDLHIVWLGASLYVVIQFPVQAGKPHNNVRAAFFTKTAKTKVAVKWRIIDIQEMWGSGLGNNMVTNSYQI